MKLITARCDSCSRPTPSTSDALRANPVCPFCGGTLRPPRAASVIRRAGARVLPLRGEARA